LKKVYKLKGSIFYPGVDNSKFLPRKRNIHYRPKLLSVGAFNYHKGFDFLLYALSGLPENLRQITIVGNGGYDLERLKSLSIRLGVKLRIKNLVSEKELISSYQSSDVFLYSPRREPFGLAFLEAMASGLPIVATCSGGYVEIMSREERKEFLRERKPEEFSNRLMELIENHDLRDKLSEKAQLIALRNDWDIAVSKLEKIILGIITNDK